MKQKWSLFLLASIVTLGALPGRPAHGQVPPAPSAPAAVAEPSAGEIADRVQAFYDRTTVFKADFQQRYWVKAYDKTKDSRGQVIFKKPGKMSWRYTNNGNRVVSDGAIVKIYERDARQMYEQRLKDSQYPAALSFLTGGAKLKQEFSLRKLNARELRFEGGFVLEGEPKQPTAAYQKLLLFIDGRTAQVRRVILLDAQGNRNRFDFDSPVVNARVPDSEFSFEPPPGTQVIKP